jgi:oxygen-independent coproporphyrinogen-3 oxidase
VPGDGRDLRSRHNLGYWLGRDYLGIGVGAVSTIDGRRWRNTPRIHAYMRALAHYTRPPREVEPLPAEVTRRERLMLGLRLDDPLELAGLEGVVDPAAVVRLRRLGLLHHDGGDRGSATLSLTRKGRLLGGGVTADLLA